MYNDYEWNISEEEFEELIREDTVGKEDEHELVYFSEVYTELRAMTRRGFGKSAALQTLEVSY